MKRIKLLFAFLIACHCSFSQEGSIKGQLVDKYTNETLPFVNVAVVDHNIGVQTDWNGFFVLDSLPKGTYILNFSFIGYKGGDLTIHINSQDTIVELLVELPFPCPQSQGRTCPICMKEDKVIPIEYGLPGKKMFRLAKKGKIKLGGCVITHNCDPFWYCTRDDKEFR